MFEKKIIRFPRAVPSRMHTTVVGTPIITLVDVTASRRIRIILLSLFSIRVRVCVCVMLLAVHSVAGPGEAY